jgi:Ran GTPase-activating protein (RanGAP) involved in mRNA processing and transport
MDSTSTNGVNNHCQLNEQAIDVQTIEASLKRLASSDIAGRSFVVSDCSFEPDALLHLAQMLKSLNLTELAISCTHLNSDIMLLLHELPGCQTIKVLDISLNSISDEVFRLVSTAIGDSQVEHLTFSENLITAESVGPLIDMLNASIITNIHLSGNFLEENACAMIQQVCDGLEIDVNLDDQHRK